MRIAFLTPTGAMGGAELCLLDALASARAIHPEWDLRALVGGGGPLATEIETLGVPCEVLPLPGNVSRLGDAGLAGHGAVSKVWRLGTSGLKASGGLASYARRLAGWLRSVKPDVVQTNGMKMHALAAWTTPASTPLIWHLHDYVGSRFAMAWLLRRSRRPHLWGVAVSRSVAADAAATLGPGVSVRTIHNRIDVDRFRPGEGRGDELDRAGGFDPPPAGTVRVGLVATFAIWKGHSLFLDAISRLPRDRRARYYIVGGPIYQSAGSQLSVESLRERANELGLSDRLVLTGHVSEPASAMRGLDVVVHASTRPEPFGRVIVEGMASGRAVVAIRDGGSSELFEDGRTALGCPPNDPDALARAIDRLIVDAELRRSLGRAGRSWAETHFDRSRLADDWARVYAEARSRTGAFAPPVVHANDPYARREAES